LIPALFIHVLFIPITRAPFEKLNIAAFRTKCTENYLVLVLQGLQGSSIKDPVKLKYKGTVKKKRARIAQFPPTNYVAELHYLTQLRLP
jgi:hypothetical protein